MKSFLRWVETTEGSPALSEPQNEKGEGGMRLAKIVENRIKAMIRNLGPEEMKKGSEQEIIAAIADCVSKMGGQAPQQNQAPANDQAAAPASQEAQPQQPQAMNPVASGNTPGNL